MIKKKMRTGLQICACPGLCNEIYCFSKQTFDAYLYQLVKSKQKFLSQMMTSKSPVRSAEDVDEVTLSFAEVKMLVTCDECFKEKMDMGMQAIYFRGSAMAAQDISKRQGFYNGLTEDRRRWRES